MRPTTDLAMPSRTAEVDQNLARELQRRARGRSAAGEILRRYFRDGGYEIDSKGNNNPVTTADLEADAALREHLAAPFRTTDGSPRRPSTMTNGFRAERVWIVDPLDGTKEFIKGIPEFVVAIALAEHGVPVIGVSYNPIKHELFWAVRGAGCFLDDSPCT